MSYSVVMRSDEYVGTTSTTASRQYAFDWTPFEEGAYEVTFSIAAKVDSATTHLAIALELPDLGATFQNFKAGSKISSQNSNIIGVFTTGGADKATSAGFGDNAPMKILSKPTNSIFTVNLFKMTTGSLIPMPEQLKGYVLILNFKRC